MPRVKEFISSWQMEVTYEVTETTTHKAMLPDGGFIRSDLDTLWIFFNKEGKVKYASRRSSEDIEAENLEWLEEDYKRVYQYELDVS